MNRTETFWFYAVLFLALVGFGLMLPKPQPNAVSGCPQDVVGCVTPKPQKPAPLPDICYVDPANNLECPNP